MTPHQLFDNSMNTPRIFPEGRNVLFPVQFTYGCPLPNVFQWFKDGDFVNVTENSRFKVDPDNFHLQIRRAEPSDAGVYRFVAKNSHGSVHYDFVLSISR